MDVQDFLGLFTLETPHAIVTEKVTYVKMDQQGCPIFLQTHQGVVYNWAYIISMKPER